MANATRVSQVFDNLIANARKYGRQGDRCEIRIGAVQDKDAVCFYVRDFGPGIAPQYHDRVFALFQRLESAKSGTGIGLSIVHKVMKNHDGKVWIESQGDNTGCTFWLRFPNRCPQKQEILVG